MIIGRTSGDGCVDYVSKNDAIIDDVIMFDNSEGGRTIKIRVRENCIPELGDKHSSRHGQKVPSGSSIGRKIFLTQRESPDIIVNPHAIPSRMTIGHIRVFVWSLRVCKHTMWMRPFRAQNRSDS